MKLILATIAAPLALIVTAPATAQDSGETAEAAQTDIVNGEQVEGEGQDPMAGIAGLMSGLFGDAFKAEPLSAEQEAGLPLAKQAIGRMMPSGSLRDMWRPMFDKFITPLMKLDKQPATSVAANKLGIAKAELSLTDSQAEEIATMFDPSWRVRKQREAAVFPDLMADLMTAMEPSMQKAMTELYAVNFSQAELGEINAFFATESGGKFARKSFTMASDPRMISASMEALPALFGVFAGMKEKMAAATADLPAQRGFDELSAKERARIASLTGYSEDELAGLSQVSEPADDAAVNLAAAVEAAEE